MHIKNAGEKKNTNKGGAKNFFKGEDNTVSTTNLPFFKPRSIQPKLINLQSQGSVIQKSPIGNDTQTLHNDLIEQYRQAHGLPPNGVDAQGQQVGPTNSEIRFGGLLSAWLLANQGQSQPSSTGSPAVGRTSAATTPSIPAPTSTPTIVGRGNTSVVAMCTGATDVMACSFHKSYVLNILPQVIANIRNVNSPYNTAIADLFSAALPQAQSIGPPVPRGPSASARAPGSVTVRFGTTSHTFTNFTLLLQQWLNGANGRAMSIGGPVAFITLNEMSLDALHGNLAGIEETIVHETIHVFQDIVEAQNTARAQGTAMSHPNLDSSSYSTQLTAMETAVTPFVRQIRSLPSFTGSPPPLKEQANISSTASTFLNEVIARTEGAIYVKQRAGLAFTTADLSNISRFYRSDSYWSPTPPTRSELVAFLQTNQQAVDTAIQPVVLQMGERYMALRP